MGRLTVAGVALIAVTYGLARFALGLFVPEFRATFSLSATEVGWIMAASFTGYLVALTIAGVAVSRFGARAVALASGFVAATGMMGVAGAPGPVALGAAATIGGGSTGLVSPSLATAVEEHLAGPERATAQTVINAGTSVGLMIAAPTALLAAANWRTAKIVFGTLALLATLAAIRLVPTDQDTRRATAVGPGSAARLRWSLRATAVLLGLSSAAFWGFGRELLEVVSGFDPTASRSAWIAVGVGGLAGGAAGTLVDRRSLRTALLTSWTLFAAAHAWLALGFTLTPAALVAAAGFGAGYMALTGLLIVWSVRERPDRPAGAVATAFLLLAAGQIVGSPMAGAIADTFGLPAAFAVASGLATAGVAIRPPAAGSRALRRSHVTSWC